MLFTQIIGATAVHPEIYIKLINTLWSEFKVTERWNKQYTLTAVSRFNILVARAMDTAHRHVKLAI
jgi:hypothetical protein